MTAREGDGIEAVLAAHRHAWRDVDTAWGRPDKQLFCTCGDGPFNRGGDGGDFDAHVAAALRASAPDTEAIAAAEQRGREDNEDHSMCYVSGSRALAAREAAAWDEGATKASPYGGGYLRSLLAQNPYRAAAIREGSDT